MVLSSIAACGPVDEGETSTVTKPTKTDGTLAEETALGTERIWHFCPNQAWFKEKGGSQQVKDPKVLTQLGIKNADDYILLIRENDETVTARNMNAP